ncbi:MAG: hypothetical protein R3202_13765 [Candidatus Competibacterales bacterium]|nr:hypothetical protein [Candidatus Competibacterales bacterium]
MDHVTGESCPRAGGPRAAAAKAGTIGSGTGSRPLDPGRSLGKTNPLNDDDLKEFVALQVDFADSKTSWTVDIADVDKETMIRLIMNMLAGEAAPP